MPLPLPNLDNRRWRDLVDEGRALIPRYAPAWTDHNVHDPGIMLVELLAWLVEGLIYRANRVPERNRRKFLSLLGYPPAPPQPATTVLSCSLASGTGTLMLPAGVVFLAGSNPVDALPFCTTHDVTLVEAALIAVQQFDGTKFANCSRMLRDTLPFAPFGSNPTVPSPYDAERAPALYLGFDAALPVGVEVSVYIAFDGSSADERQRIIAEATARAAACTPVLPTPKCKPCPPHIDPWCDDDPSSGEPADSASGSTEPEALLPPHHSVRLAWEYLASDGWHVLSPDAGEIVDDTRALTLDGSIRVRLPAPMTATQVGAVAEARFWLRCRLIAGRYDAAPEIIAVLHNAVAVEQSLPAIASYAVAPGVVASGAITPGAVQSLALELDPDGVVQSLAVLTPADPDSAEAPQVLVVDYTPATATTAGALVLGLERALVGTGFPDQHAAVSAAPVARGAVQVWSVEGSSARRWTLRPDFDASSWTDSTVVLDADNGELRFGTGARGRVPPQDASVLVAYSSTAAARGNVSSRSTWMLAVSPINSALLGATAVVAASLSVIANPLAAAGGASGESIDEAAERAVAALWAHERLTRLCPAPSCETLDQLDADTVTALPAPQRATTSLDFERIARDVPGTRVRRARAWAEIDPAMPGVIASGTVTLVILPELPTGRPSPTAGLLGAVRRYLDRRRVLCTRLVVVGPTYVVVSVNATVKATSGADTSRVATGVRAALDAFFDPLTGGPAGWGWPFGRDVFRSEVLALVDSVVGVDHVLELTLSADSGETTCDNVCVAPTRLVASGTHTIRVESA